jgi:acyl-CoA synthetase (AMP-forming)/AMP-acid ligase II
MSVFSFLDKSADRYGQQPAVFHGTRRHLTYGELRRCALALGAAIGRYGMPGDRVLMVAPNCPEYVEIIFGIWAAGLVAVPINAKLHPREIREIAEDSGAHLAFASPKLASELVGGSLTTVVPIGSSAYAKMLAHEPAAACERLPDDLAWLFFTSGTTGRSKGAMLTHRNLMAMSISHVADLEPIEQRHAIIHSAPMSHGSGLYMLPYTMRAARHVVPTSGSFDPAEFLDLADAHAGAGAFLAPTMVRRLRLAMVESRRPTHGLRSIVYGGAPMYLEEIKQSLKVLGPVLSQLYGQGEAPMTITGLSVGDHLSADDEVLKSVGWPRSGVEVRVIDECGRTLPTGEIGEIICRSDIVMRGYWNNPEATAAALCDGWLRTGDMGSFDEAGCLTLRDRSKDVIISGGTNIYPREVEEAILSHPEVAEVCVVGIDDLDWGESVAAVVVREPGAAVEAIALEQHCLERIARFKRPKRYVFVEALPKNNYGKVLKREVAQMFAQPKETAI